LLPSGKKEEKRNELEKWYDLAVVPAIKPYSIWGSLTVVSIGAEKYKSLVV
jgi:hypothetical protein